MNYPYTCYSGLWLKNFTFNFLSLSIRSSSVTFKRRATYCTYNATACCVAGLAAGGIHIHGYADDICLVALGTFPNTVSGFMQWALHTTETWCDEGGLLVNPDKIEKKNPWFLWITILGVSLSCSMSVKYLVVVLDSRLTWMEHVDVKVRKVHNLLWACRMACGAAWGLRPKWSIGCTCLSFGRPSLLHPYFGVLSLRRLVQRKG